MKCSVCFGQGHLGLLTEDEEAIYGPDEFKDTECDECEGTGVISEERGKELLAATRARLDQVNAKLREFQTGT